MSNVVRFAARPKMQPNGGIGALLACFARFRRHEGDAYWLKENAELLGILATSGRKLSREDLQAYAGFYAGLETRLSFFPQYYRLLLGMALSLEALGFAGNKAAAMAAQITRDDWFDSEVSDIQRAESRYLLARAGQPLEDDGLSERLHRFVNRPATFAIPNQRAAYDLLHIVFYLTNYGQTRAVLPIGTQRALTNTGTLALLEQNSDLLAETCIALRYANMPIPELWLQTVRDQAAGMLIGASVNCDDAYHNYLVNQWLLSTMGSIAFEDIYQAAPMSFALAPKTSAPLREMSQALLGMGATRSDDWAAMRDRCASALSAPAQRVLEQAELAVDGFGAFFADFARAAHHRR